MNHGHPFDNGESFNVMLAIGKQRQNNLLSVGGDFNNPTLCRLRTRGARIESITPLLASATGHRRAVAFEDRQVEVKEVDVLHRRVVKDRAVGR